MKLAESLKGLALLLEASGAPFAVVGGLAASARGEARFTRDIDVAVGVSDDQRAEQVLFELSQHGYRVIATIEHDVTERLATARAMDGRGVVCDLVFATCGIEWEIVRSATPLRLFEDFEVPTATAEALLAMKVLSAVPERPRDAGDIQAIVRANPAFDEGLVLRLIEQIQSRGYARQQNLSNKWQDLKRELKLGV